MEYLKHLNQGMKHLNFLDNVNHFQISIVKLYLRIIGFLILILSEILGIFEEHADKRKE